MSIFKKIPEGARRKLRPKPSAKKDPLLTQRP